MSIGKQWAAAIGVVVVAVVLASVQRKRELEDAKATKEAMTLVTNIFIEAIPETK